MTRADGRRLEEMRPVIITRNFQKFAPGSVLIEFGNTRVICSACIENKVPLFLRNEKTGWITAEYSILPGATSERTVRDSSRGRISGRSHEIQRLIGRSLRAVVDLKALGEKTIWIDCDVIQADGGTRTAAVTGAWFALFDALLTLENRSQVFPLTDYLAAVSVGIVQGTVHLDLDYAEDSNADVDLNLVMTGNSKIVEIQGTAEHQPFGLDSLNHMLTLAKSGIEGLFEKQRQFAGEYFKNHFKPKVAG